MISASLCRPRVVAARASAKESGAAPAPVAAVAKVDRRSVLGLVAGVAAVVAAPGESKAAYGEAANVFGKVSGAAERDAFGSSLESARREKGNGLADWNLEKREGERERERSKGDPDQARLFSR